MDKAVKTIISLEIPTTLKEQLRIEAEANELTISALIRLILKTHYAKKN